MEETKAYGRMRYHEEAVEYDDHFSEISSRLFHGQVLINDRWSRWIATILRSRSIRTQIT